MAWNLNVYDKFKTERTTPFYDLLSLVKVRENISVVDLGCGTGELTQKLAETLPNAKVVGVDASPEMLEKSKAFESDRLQFYCRGIEEQIETKQQWDLVFSNAAIQWVYNHQQFLPKLIATIHKGGQLAIQMPAQQHNISNILLSEIAATAPFAAVLKDQIQPTPMLEIDDYAQILYEQGGTDIQVFEKVYPLILQDANAVYDWVSGSALIPYLERLDEVIQQQFIAEFKAHLQSRFPASPAFYPFRRILMVASF